MSKYFAQIGQSYSASFFSGGGFTKTSLALSHSSLSGVGKTYTSTSKGIISFTAPLYTVSSIGLEYSMNHLFLIVGVLLSLSGSLLLAAPGFKSMLTGGQTSLHGHALPLLVFGLGLLSLIKYIFSKRRYLVVNVQGYCYALSLRGISNEDVEAFIDHTIRLMKLCPMSVHVQSPSAGTQNQPAAGN
jgi:hypothetical protein